MQATTTANGPSFKATKTNPKINELIEQMQQTLEPKTLPLSSSLGSADFDLRIENTSLSVTPSKVLNAQNGMSASAPTSNSKKKKEIKSESQSKEQNPESATMAESPAKLNGKRRRSSQKANETGGLSNANGNSEKGMIFMFFLKSF